MNRSTITARAVWRSVLVLAITTATLIEIVTLVTHDEQGNDAGWTLFLISSLLLLWSHDTENRERIADLERREADRLSMDNALVARTAEVMESAWRNDLTYREQRQKREASEKYLRKLKDGLR